MRRSASTCSTSSSTRSSRSGTGHPPPTPDLSTNLQLGLSLRSPLPEQGGHDLYCINLNATTDDGDGDGDDAATLFVKVYMEGHPIGRKLNILAHRCYQDLIATLDHMFNANILWGEEVDAENCEDFHVLTYEDEEGDWMMVGDVPWEMFLSAVKRLKITRACPC